MSNDLTINNEHVPAPERDRKNHVPSPGDIYFSKNTYNKNIYRITTVEKKEDYTLYGIEEYDLLESRWVVPKYSKTVSKETLDEYYLLLLDDFEETLSLARAAVAGDSSALDALITKADDKPETMALVASKPAEQVFALTETAERLQNKIDTVKDCMEMIISSLRSQMEERVRGLDTKLKRIKDYVRNLQRIITVMNLYTGKDVDILVVKEGESAAPGEPIHIRQRILFMDEEYLASAENGGIDYNDIAEFNRWLSEPANLDIVLPEQRCIVAMKPKRYDANYSHDWYTNKLLNEWNHHTMILFRDGERILLIDSEDLELYGTAIPYSDQAIRFEEKYKKIVADKSFQESNLESLRKESEDLGYMYTKYISFLQGVIDSGKIFDMSKGRPNLAKGEGVIYVHDDENAIGTGRDWEAFKKELNRDIRRGTRILFSPYPQDGFGRGIPSGEPNRYYMHECNAPGAPEPGVYNVDYPTKTSYVKNLETGHYEKTTSRGKRLAIFYTPRKPWKFDDDPDDRTEAWIYNPECCINYDALTVELIDEFMSDRTQRPHFRGWMPLLQQARQRLVEEKSMEETFKTALGWEIRKENPAIPQESLPDLLDEAVHWWKNKVIFTRPLSVDDAKAWRMIKGEIKRKVKQNKS